MLQQPSFITGQLISKAYLLPDVLNSRLLFLCFCQFSTYILLICKLTEGCQNSVMKRASRSSWAQVCLCGWLTVGVARKSSMCHWTSIQPAPLASTTWWLSAFAGKAAFARGTSTKDTVCERIFLFLFFDMKRFIQTKR